MKWWTRTARWWMSQAGNRETVSSVAELFWMTALQLQVTKPPSSKSIGFCGSKWPWETPMPSGRLNEELEGTTGRDFEVWSWHQCPRQISHQN
jgi:hypothetical protein